jgi:hypothetical protein
MIVVATHRLFIGSLVFSWLVLCLLPVAASSAPYFEDGYLGLTQTELHDKLGLPQAARDRKAALRVFKYYSYADWQKYFKKLISPQNGEDVYTFKRDGVEVRYSFGFVTNPNDHSDEPTLYVNLVDVEFSQPVPISQVPALVPEFRPPSEADAPAFRSNIWLLVFKGSPSPDARFVVRDPTKDRWDWTLAFQLFSLQGLPQPLTLTAKVDRMEIGAQSLQLTQKRLKNTHEPILNPYSQEFANLPPPAPPAPKKIPMPQYAE